MNKAYMNKAFAFLLAVAALGLSVLSAPASAHDSGVSVGGFLSVSPAPGVNLNLAFSDPYDDYRSAQREVYYPALPSPRVIQRVVYERPVIYEREQYRHMEHEREYGRREHRYWQGRYRERDRDERYEGDRRW